LVVTMSQKSSVPQVAKSVSQALIPDTAAVGAESHEAATLTIADEGLFLTDADRVLWSFPALLSTRQKVYPPYHNVHMWMAPAGKGFLAS
jgi:hypothetical protein